MRRRSSHARAALGLLVGLAIAAPAAAQRAAVQRATADILILGGRVVDGTGNPWTHLDVGVAGDRITFVGNARAAGIAARDTVRADGMLVTPGFWDVHSHATLDSEHGRFARAPLYQGITTVVLGVDGGGTNNVAETFAGYERAGIAVNAVRYVGHGAERGEVMGVADREPTPAELDAMKAYVRKGMEEGAVGLSTGLFYSPGYFANADEVVELARVAAEFGGSYDTHDRDLGVAYQGIGYLNSIREGIEIGERAGTPVIVSHFNAQGVQWAGRAAEGAALIDAARARGVEVVAGQHVYTATNSNLASYALPRWAAVGGRDSMLARFRGPATRARLAREVPANLDPRGGASVMNLELYDEGNTRLLAAKEWMMTCTDGYTPGDTTIFSHPRSYGSFTRKLRVYALDEKIISLPFAVRGMTSMPARFYGFPDRGLIAEGYHADVVVLDLATLRDNNTYEKPHQLASGTVHVLVNGRFALRDRRDTGVLAGRPLRRVR